MSRYLFCSRGFSNSWPYNDAVGVNRDGRASSAFDGKATVFALSFIISFSIREGARHHLRNRRTNAADQGIPIFQPGQVSVSVQVFPKVLEMQVVAIVPDVFFQFAVQALRANLRKKSLFADKLLACSAQEAILSGNASR